MGMPCPVCSYSHYPFCLPQQQSNSPALPPHHHQHHHLSISHLIGHEPPGLHRQQPFLGVGQGPPIPEAFPNCAPIVGARVSSSSSIVLLGHPPLSPKRGRPTKGLAIPNVRSRPVVVGNCSFRGQGSDSIQNSLPHPSVSRSLAHVNHHQLPEPVEPFLSPMDPLLPSPPPPPAPNSGLLLSDISSSAGKGWPAETDMHGRPSVEKLLSMPQWFMDQQRRSSAAKDAAPDGRSSVREELASRPHFGLDVPGARVMHQHQGGVGFMHGDHSQEAAHRPSESWFRGDIDMTGTAGFKDHKLLSHQIAAAPTPAPGLPNVFAWKLEGAPVRDRVMRGMPSATGRDMNAEQNLLSSRHSGFAPALEQRQSSPAPPDFGHSCGGGVGILPEAGRRERAEETSWPPQLLSVPSSREEQLLHEHGLIGNDGGRAGGGSIGRPGGGGHAVTPFAVVDRDHHGSVSSSGKVGHSAMEGKDHFSRTGRSTHPSAGSFLEGSGEERRVEAGRHASAASTEAPSVQQFRPVPADRAPTAENPSSFERTQGSAEAPVLDHSGYGLEPSFPGRLRTRQTQLVGQSDRSSSSPGHRDQEELDELYYLKHFVRPTNDGFQFTGSGHEAGSRSSELPPPRHHPPPGVSPITQPLRGVAKFFQEPSSCAGSQNQAIEQRPRVQQDSDGDRMPLADGMHHQDQLQASFQSRVFTSPIRAHSQPQHNIHARHGNFRQSPNSSHYLGRSSHEGNVQEQSMTPSYPNTSFQQQHYQPSRSAAVIPSEQPPDPGHQRPPPPAVQLSRQQAQHFPVSQQSLPSVQSLQSVMQRQHRHTPQLTQIYHPASLNHRHIPVPFSSPSQGPLLPHFGHQQRGEQTHLPSFYPTTTTTPGMYQRIGDGNEAGASMNRRGDMEAGPGNSQFSMLPSTPALQHPPPVPIITTTDSPQPSLPRHGAATSPPPPPPSPPLSYPPLPLPPPPSTPPLPLSPSLAPLPPPPPPSSSPPPLPPNSPPSRSPFGLAPASDHGSFAFSRPPMLEDRLNYSQPLNVIKQSSQLGLYGVGFPSTGPWYGHQKSYGDFWNHGQLFPQRPARQQDKPNMVDAVSIFRKPGRLTRPDRIVVILRGLPGSGKSHMVKGLRDVELMNGGTAPRIHSIDDYFMIEVEKVEEEAGTTPRNGGTKKRVVEKVTEYCYEAEMEQVYRGSMLKAFRKTLEEGLFPFIIVDDRNVLVADFAQFWASAKRFGYEVYLLESPSKEPAECAARSIHKFSEDQCQEMASRWEPAPPMYFELDASSLFRGDDLNDKDITEVEMDADDMEREADDQEEDFQSGGHLAHKAEYRRENGSGATTSTGDRWEDSEGEAEEERVKPTKRVRFSDDSKNNTSDTSSNSSSPGPGNNALRGLMQAYGKREKSVRWADDQGEKDDHRRYSIGSALQKITDLVIGPGPGYNKASNPARKEDYGLQADTERGSRSKKLHEQYRAEQETFKAVFSSLRTRGKDCWMTTMNRDSSHTAFSSDLQTSRIL